MNVRIFLSLCNVCVHRLDLGLCSHLKEFLGNGVRTHANSQGKILSTWKIFLSGGWNLWHCIMQDSEPNTLPTELFQPPSGNNSDWRDLLLPTHEEILKQTGKKYEIYLLNRQVRNTSLVGTIQGTYRLRASFITNTWRDTKNCKGG